MNPRPSSTRAEVACPREHQHAVAASRDTGRGWNAVLLKLSDITAELGGTHRHAFLEKLNYPRPLLAVLTLSLQHPAKVKDKGRNTVCKLCESESNTYGSSNASASRRSACVLLGNRERRIRQVGY